jgi:hypothetical protein
MAKIHYLPTSDKDRTVWLNNFSAKLAPVAASLGILPAEVTSVANDAANCTYAVNNVEIMTTNKEQRVTYKNLILNGPLGKVAGSPPALPVIPAAPAAVAPGIFPRTGQLVQRIKNSSNYTEAIGRDLGIIGAEQLMDAAMMKPVLKLVFKGGQVEVQWVKGDADAVHIEVDRGAGTWQFLAIDTVPHYPDTTAITAAATWKYRAIYILDDERVGQWSDIASITVG